MEQFSLTDIKKKNLSDVYHYIYMNPSCSKQDIATALSVSLPTVSQHLTTLESEQLIENAAVCPLPLDAGLMHIRLFQMQKSQ